MNEELKTKIANWANSIGHRMAQARLITEGAAPATAVKLVSGKYKPNPGPLLLNAIERALKDHNEAS